MEDEKPREDISKEIEESVEKVEPSVTKEIAEKEEKIAKGVSEVPVAKDDLIKRKEKIVKFLKEKQDWVYFLVLAFVVFLGVWIRTRNLSGLKDVTTGTWTLGPDLDPFLFLRWAKYIVEHGKLFALDVMRSVPLAEICSGAQCNPISTAREMGLLSYMIAGFHKFISIFSDVSVTYSAVIFPVVMFALTTVAFFLFVRKIFYKENKKTRNIIGLIATLFFVLVPSLLPRTIAGIPEKESAAFFFMFMAFYFFLEALTSEKFRRGMAFGIGAGIMTALMALVWGGVIFVFFTIPPVVLLAFVFKKIKKKEFYIYSSWVFTSLFVMFLFSARYTISSLIHSLSTGNALGVFFLVGFSLLFMKNEKLERLRKKTKLPREIFYVLVAGIVLLVLALVILGPESIWNEIVDAKNSLIQPIVDRFGQTVAENKQPYFMNDWRSSFGPVKFNIPLYFWLFLAGSVLLFSHLIRNFRKKEKRILVFSYFIFLICLIFSRYSPSSSLNGTNSLSLLVYFSGWILLLASAIYVYRENYKRGSMDLFKELNFAYLLYFIVLTLGIIGARGGIRLIMVLGAISPIAVAFLFFKLPRNYLKEKDDMKKFFIGVFAVVVIIASMFTVVSYYQQDRAQAAGMATGPYQEQWQRAMQWVRESTEENAVFAHWWDYGYWLQSIGERATVLDGGNSIGYWNHLMGRHVLTGTDRNTALEFLYAHNVTHLLIDSTEIGKYGAYSSIGSDENYDRLSWIPTFHMDESRTQETSEGKTYLYAGGTGVDEDIILETNGEDIFLPQGNAALGGIIIKVSNSGRMSQPTAVFVYNGKQYEISLRFAYYNNELLDFKTGLGAGVFLYPRVKSGSEINLIGSAFYLSKRTIDSQLARLYLFGEEDENFVLAHEEKNQVIGYLEAQGVDVGSFVEYQGFQGPIKIWEINYPSDIELNEAFLETHYPEEIRI